MLNKIVKSELQFCISFSDKGTWAAKNVIHKITFHVHVSSKYPQFRTAISNLTTPSCSAQNTPRNHLSKNIIFESFPPVQMPRTPLAFWLPKPNILTYSLQHSKTLTIIKMIFQVLILFAETTPTKYVELVQHFLLDLFVSFMGYVWINCLIFSQCFTFICYDLSTNSKNPTDWQNHT